MEEKNEISVKDKVLSIFKSPKFIIGVLAFIAGLVIGLVVLGWWIWPVKWINAQPEHLAYEAKVEYMRMAIEAYGTTRDAAVAQVRFQSVGEDAGKALTEIAQQPGSLNPTTISEFGSLVNAPVAATIVPGATPPPATPGATPAPVEKPKSRTNILLILIPILCVLVLVLVAVVVYIFVLRPRGGGGPPSPAQQAEEARRTATWTDYAASGAEPPLAKFMSSYKFGDDLYDDLYNVDHPSGEWLGECGVEIAEMVVEGSPKRVCALDVWLYDKTDPETVTKVILSNHAFNATSIYTKLKSKGEPFLAEPGASLYLETKALRMVARIANMAYGESPTLPPESFFDQVVLELSVWQK